MCSLRVSLSVRLFHLWWCSLVCPCHATAWHWSVAAASPDQHIAPFADRFEFGSTTLSNGTILVTGGIDTLRSTGAQRDVWVGSWDFPADGTKPSLVWSLRSAAAAWVARSGHALVTLSDDAVVLFGGRFDSTDVWGSSDGGATFHLLASSSAWEARRFLRAVAIERAAVQDAVPRLPLEVSPATSGPKVIFFAGGQRNVEDVVIFFNDCWVSFDGGVTFVRTVAAAPWAPRSRAALAVSHYTPYLASNSSGEVVRPSHRLVLAGGLANVSGVLQAMPDVWASTDLGMTWVVLTSVAPWPARRSALLLSASATWIQGTHSSTPSSMSPSTSLLLVGGHTTAANLKDMWVSTDGGTTWTQAPDPTDGLGNAAPSGALLPWGPNMDGTILSTGHVALWGGALGVSGQSVWTGSRDAWAWKSNNCSNAERPASAIPKKPAICEARARTLPIAVTLPAGATYPSNIASPAPGLGVWEPPAPTITLGSAQQRVSSSNVARFVVHFSAPVWNLTAEDVLVDVDEPAVLRSVLVVHDPGNVTRYDVQVTVAPSPSGLALETPGACPVGFQDMEHLQALPPSHRCVYVNERAQSWLASQSACSPYSFPSWTLAEDLSAVTEAMLDAGVTHAWYELCCCGLFRCSLSTGFLAVAVLFDFCCWIPAGWVCTMQRRRHSFQLSTRTLQRTSLKPRTGHRGIPTTPSRLLLCVFI